MGPWTGPACLRLAGGPGRGGAATGLRRRTRMPRPIARLRDVFEAAAAEDAFRPGLGDAELARRSGVLVPFLDQEPAPAVRVAPVAPPEADQGPASAKLLAGEGELQPAFTQPGDRIAGGHPGAPVPHENRSATVLARGDDALEAAVLERVVLGLHGEAFVGGIEARPLGDGPAHEHATDLEAEVVVEAAGGVLLDHERRAPTARERASTGLRCFGEVPLGLVQGKWRPLGT